MLTKPNWTMIAGLGTLAGENSVGTTEIADGAVTAAKLAAGVPIQTVSAVSTTYATVNSAGTERIPGDDTIPQSGEGKQIVSLAIIPKLAGSILRVRAFIPLIQAGGSGFITTVGALFRDSAAGAMATGVTLLYAGCNGAYLLETEVAAGSTVATTFALRFGPVENVPLYLLGNNTSRLFGGALRISLGITEIKN